MYVMRCKHQHFKHEARADCTARGYRITGYMLKGERDCAFGLLCLRRSKQCRTPTSVGVSRHSVSALLCVLTFALVQRGGLSDQVVLARVRVVATPLYRHHSTSEA